jgi:hypothetical protein
MDGLITFSTCWYVFKAKFDTSVYKKWLHNMLTNVNNYNLVVYCDIDSYGYIFPYLTNDRIMAIIKPMEEFYTWKYREKWIENHEHNMLLNTKVDWKLNMLWCEKINFVRETIENKYFDTEYYGWCDIGYFRGRSNDLPINMLEKWPSHDKIMNLDKTKIYYAQINNNQFYMDQLKKLILNKNSVLLPKVPIPPDQLSIAGGFFISHFENIPWWHNEFYGKLERYFSYNYLVKDDQIIVADCVFSNMHRFHLCKENNVNYDNWFLFQRYLL